MRENGYSLISLLFGSFLLAGTFLVYNNVQKTQTKGQRNDQINIEISDLQKNIKTILSSQKTCLINFSQLDLTKDNELNSIKNSKGTPVIQVGSSFGKRLISLESITLGKLTLGQSNVIQGLLSLKLKKLGAHLGADVVTKNIGIIFVFVQGRLFSCERSRGIKNV